MLAYAYALPPDVFHQHKGIIKLEFNYTIMVYVLLEI